MSTALRLDFLGHRLDSHKAGGTEFILIAGIGVNLSQRHIENDDTLGEELFFLFGEIAEAVVEAQRRRPTN